MYRFCSLRSDFYCLSVAPYPVRPARPRPYLDFEKEKVAAAAAARRHYRGLTWLGRAHRAGGAPVSNLKKPTCASKRDALELATLQ